MKFARLGLVAVIASMAVACGGGKSPTSPTTTTSTPSASATRVIALDGTLAFGDVVVGQSKELVVTIRNTGTGTMTLTGITGSGGVTTQTAASPTTGTIPAGGSLNVTFRFTPTTTGSISGTITFTTDHTSGTNTITLTAAGVGAPVTVVGVVTDAGTRAPIGGVRVAALKNDATLQNFATTTTDGNGYYSIVVPSATAISLQFSKDGYTFRSSVVTFSADTRQDQTLSVAAPAAAALEYRVTGTGLGLSAGLTYSNCSGGTSQQSDAQLPWSFTCASVRGGQFLYISAQNNRSSGCVKTQIFKRGILYRESESCGAYVIATASGSY